MVLEIRNDVKKGQYEKKNVIFILQFYFSVPAKRILIIPELKL